MSPEQSDFGPDQAVSPPTSPLSAPTEGAPSLSPYHPDIRPEMHEVLPRDDQGDTRVADKDEALEGAYAQKPFVDAKLNYADDLTESQKVALDWLGSAEAEKAMAKYRAGKEQMTEAEQAIVERIEKLKTISDGNREYSLSHIQLGVNVPDRDKPEIKETKLNQAETLLATVIDMKVAEVMGRDDLTESQKLAELSSLSFTQSVVREDLGLGQGGGSRRSTEVEGLVREFVSHPSSTREALMLGKIVSGLVNRQELDCAIAIEKIADITHSSFDDAFAPYKPMIEQSYQEGHGHDIDNVMERHGYIWSERKGKFLKLASEQ